MYRALLFLWLLFAIPSIAQQPGALDWQFREGQVQHRIGAGQETLFSTMPGLPAVPYGITSQVFVNDPNQYMTFAADDFLIGEELLGWRLETIQVEGVYFGGGDGPADSVNVYILNVPPETMLPTTTSLVGPDVIFSGPNLGYTDLGSGDFEVQLPNGGLILMPGRYWLIVQAEMALDPGGQWGWAESALTPDSGQGVGFESAWFQTEPFVVMGNCTDAWGMRITDCDNRRTPNDGTPDEPDLAFTLLGQAFPQRVIFNPQEALRTSENGGQSHYAVSLSEQPTSDVTITATIDQPGEALFEAPGGQNATQMLVFSATNWNTPQVLTLVGQDDANADGTQIFTINHTTQSLDNDFDGIPFLQVTGNNIDNECHMPSNFSEQLPDFPNWINVQELIQALCLTP